MFAPLLALALAAQPMPHAGVYAAHATALSNLRTFLTRASAFAPVLSPGPLGRALGAPLAVDALDVGGWPEAGLDPKGPVLAGEWDSGFALVLPLRDASKALARARASLPSSGAVTEAKSGDSTLLVARRPGSGPNAVGELAAAVAISRKRAAIWLGGGDPEFLRAALTARLPGLERARGLSGDWVATAVQRRGVGAAVGLAPAADALAVDARVYARGPIAVANRADPFAGFAPAGMLYANVSLAPQALPNARAQLLALLRALLTQTRKPVPRAELGALLDGLAGPVALVATGLNTARGPGSTFADRYFLVSHAYAAQVRDPAKATAALDALVNAMHAAQMPLTDAPEGAAKGSHQVQLGPNRALFFGLEGSVLYLANDAEARTALLSALPKAPAPSAHAGSLTVDGPRAGSQLAHLSILDAARSSDLAALFGLAVEAGPLLKALGTTTFSAEPEPHAVRLRGTLALPAARP